MRKLVAFVLRGYRIESSYKLAFFARLLWIIGPMLVLHFASKLVDAGRPPQLAKYGGGYFEFAVVGVVLSQYFAEALRISGESLRRSQLSGVLEAILSTGTRPALFILYDAAYAFGFACMSVMIALLVGAFFFDAQFGNLNPVSLLCTMVLGSSAVASLSILSAAATLRFKKGDPVQFIFGTMGAMLSGVYFPISLFPTPVRALSYLLPATHAIEAARLAVTSGATVAELSVPLGALAAITVVLFPLGLWSFEASVAGARRDGTLLHY